MRVRVRRNRGWKPINVRLRFDSRVEYEVFKAMIGDYTATPQHISERLTGIISSCCGVRLTKEDVKECLKGLMKRIWMKLPRGEE